MKIIKIAMLILLPCICYSQNKVDKMKKVSKDSTDIPVSVIKGSTVNVNNGPISGNVGLLYNDSTCVITSLNNKIHLIASTADFNPETLPDKIRSRVAKATTLNLINSHDQSDSAKVAPPWLPSMTQLIILKLEGVRIENFAFLESSNLKHLILKNVKLGNKQAFVMAILACTGLKYLVCDDLVGMNDFAILTKERPDLTILSNSEYVKRIKSGSISKADYESVVED